MRKIKYKKYNGIVWRIIQRTFSYEINLYAPVVQYSFEGEYLKFIAFYDTCHI